MENEPLTTKRKTLGQVLVCVGCCCGRVDRGKPPVPVDWLKASWKERKLLKAIQLTISGCLGPCDLVNVVSIVTPTRMHWLGGLTEQTHFDALLEWATASVAAGRLLPLPGLLAAQEFERFQALTAAAGEQVA
ncbi:MAG: (2Fe-2S) ferredoxin domain-containing protein [Blastocatellia bacterium]|nr:(2Fe-2S) ferredoxin domain-containing protein [Blastocatellia bacterium]